MSGIDDAFLEETIRVWQPMTAETLTKEDAREIIHNIAGLFNLLIKLEIEREKDNELYK